MNLQPVNLLRRSPVSTVAAALVSALLCASPAQAVLLDGFFELDGNTADTNAGAIPDDWESFHPSATGNTTRATGIISDTITAPAVFRNGSKDTQDISAWRFDIGSSPPKDDMLHAYAAAYTATAARGSTTSVGDLLIYFGADRAAFSGTASLGFWFFKKDVEAKNGSFFLRGTNTPATHSIGDVLVAFEYTNGGAVTGVRTFVWTSAGLTENPPIGAAPTTTPGVYCDALDKVCGSTNSGGLTLPWNGAVQPGQFFEGGINLTKLLPGGDTCFASFMATSRSSTSPTSAIKNFILGGFPVCHLTVTKACPDPGVYDPSTNKILFTVKGRVYNDGGGALSNITVTDSPTNFTTAPGFFTCDANGMPTTTAASPVTLAVGAEICYVGQYATSSFTAIDTVTASASGGVSNTAQATCTLPQPGLSLTEACDMDLVAGSNSISLKLNLKGSVTNTGAVVLSPVNVCHTPDGSTTETCTTVAASLAAGATAAYGPITYSPTVASSKSALSALLNPHEAVFKAKVRAVGTPPAVFGLPAINVGPHDVQCELCAATIE